MKVVKLDGSHGAGIMSTLTITKRARHEESGKLVETYRLPFGVICFDQLFEQVKVGFILGFGVEKDIDHEMERFLDEHGIPDVPFDDGGDR